MRNTKNLNHGNPGNKGGSGRPPDWLKNKCKKIVESKKLVEFLGEVAAGKDFEQGVGDQGEIIKIPASIQNRLKATEILFDRGWGKCAQPIESESLQKFVIELVKFGNSEKGKNSI